MAKGMWTAARRTSHCKIMGINMESVLLPFSHKSTDVGRLGLARSLRSNSSQRCSTGLRSGLCGGQSSSSTHTDLDNQFSVLTSLCERGHCQAETGKGHKVGSRESPGVALYAVALRFPFTRTKGPSTNHEKQPQTISPPTPNITVGTMHSDW